MFHWIKLRVFIYATEDRDKVMEALHNTGIDGEMKSEIAEGAYGDRIEILEIKGKKKSEIDALFKSLSKDEIKSMIETLEDRIDDEGIFHFRLEKQEMYGNHPVLSSGGDIIAIEVKIASYPSSREKAVEVMREYLEAFL